MITYRRCFKDIALLRIVKVDGVFAGQVRKRSGRYPWTAVPADKREISEDFRTLKEAVVYLRDGLMKGFER